MANEPDTAQNALAYRSLKSGIETAFDVPPVAVLNVPSFGEALTARLLLWRTECERKFRYDQSRGVPANMARSIQQKDTTFESQIQRQLKEGPFELRKINRRIRQKFEVEQSEYQQMKRHVAQASADLAAIDRK